MKYKNIIVLVILVVSLLAVSAVSAADNATDDIISTDVSKDVVGIENTTDEVVSIESPADDSAGVKNQDEGVISENDDNVLTANPKTFTDLNNLINGNDDSDVYLESNYTFSMDSDSAFIEGIHINRDVTVHGNGHTIDGDNSAGIFRAEYSDVVFKDIVFVNANSASFGAAMYGGSAVNCTFIGNSAEYGGAMSGGSAVNCTFINNSANSYGGAMHYCFAVNCTFINNSANDWGGAIYCTNALGCTFVDNSANYGGAINSQYFSGYVVNCTFIHNSASYGGAMWNAESAVNCTFINNSAYDWGGAIASESDSYVMNCTFINNSANKGGATYQATISDCTFINNTARECGGAMMNGICFNSTFISNHAAKDGGAIFDVVVASSLFEYNSAENGGAMSRGIAKNCTFNYNSATVYGGAVYDAKVSTDSQFNNNNAPNGKDTYEVTCIENSNAKSFTDLKNLIEESGSEVYLNDNYAFDLVSDSILYEGIIVNHTVTVYGNGFTIDGNYLARIFSVDNNDVVFKDIVFVNGKAADDGGAIKGYSTVVNCTFINNAALQSGGAIHNGSAVNCTFINNAAQGWMGGAIDACYNYVVNCTFINNNALWCGGAINDGSAVNCTFIGNSAQMGGAIHESSAVDCTFIDNVAAKCGGAVDSVGGDFMNCVFVNNSAGAWGGAISGADYVNVVNSTFINNSAADDAGAIWSAGSVVNSTFINNSAGGSGGAVGSFRDMPITNSIFIGNIANNGGAASYQVIISNCKFSNNTARECGGAIMDGICINSAFTNNHAAKDGGAIYDVLAFCSSFEYNSAENGGAMSKGIAKNCTFNYNSATAYGGAVYDAKVSTGSQFNNNEAHNGKDTYEVTWIENSNGKSFTDLKNLINQSGSEVYLNDSYAFDLISDLELREGISIYSEVTIHGNGFTIDGNNLARIFCVDNNDVVFRDIVFANARFAGEGGAISGTDYVNVVNCTFINNFAVIAGAMFMGSAVNCTFINNYGGALYGGSAVNCTFVGNSAEYGGAIRDSGSIVNCTFVGNSAEFGGAMSGGSAVNCTFVGNSADNGGAMYGCSAVNCNFINNTAKAYGGAMTIGGSAVNCTFVGNSADNGGAMSGGSAVNCNFINNTAKAYGGATCYCEVVDCIFKGNTAGIVGDDFYPVGFVLVVHDFISTYKSGDKLLIYLMDDDVSIMDEEIIIKIYKNDSIIGTYHCLSGDGWVVDLDIGNYAALISFEGNDNYDPRNATAKITVISPPSSSLTINDVNTTVGHEITLVANVNSTEPINGGTVTFFDGDAYIGEAYVYEGVASLTYTPDVAGEHIITAVFNSNNYLSSNATAKITVNKANNQINIYFDASAIVDGDGSVDNPYKYFDGSRIQSNSNMYFKNGYYPTDLRGSYSNISFYGENPDKTIIDFQKNIINVDASIFINNISFKQSSWYIHNNITALNSIFIENYDGVQSIFTFEGYGCTLLFDNCSFINSSSYNGGALLSAVSSNMIISNCKFINNFAMEGGAINAKFVRLNISNTIFKNNRGNVSAGAIYYDAGELFISNCTFINNTAYSGGSVFLGQIYSNNKTTTVIINNSKFDNNQAFAGGSILSTVSVNFYLNECDFINSYSVKGGALSLLGTDSNIFNCNFENNHADDGASIYQICGDLKSSNSTFINNTANNGGGIFIFKINSTNLTNNDFFDNAGFAIVCDNENLSYQSNIFINNGVFLKYKFNLFIGDGNYTFLITDDTFNGTLPEKYDPADYDLITPARNQGSMNYCWVFGTIATLESCILKTTGEKFDFSEMNVVNLNSAYSYGLRYDREAWGSYGAISCLLNWFGPIDEKDDFYYSDKPLSPILNSSLFHIQNVKYIQRDNILDLNPIKEAILKYGAVGADTLVDLDYFNGFSYYNPNIDEGYLEGHEFSIVGWDDNYSKENFKVTPPGDGAWIIKNSWDAFHRGDGCFYMSYYNPYLGLTDHSLFTFVFNDTVKFDKNYQYDFGEYLQYPFSNNPSFWYKNIYNSTDDEYLAAVSTYFYGDYDWVVFIYVNDEIVHTQSGRNGYGYYTIDLDKFIPLKKNDTFEIKFKITTLNGDIPQTPYAHYKFNDVNGKSFISSDDNSWYDLSELCGEPLVCCIKGFTFLNKINTNIALNIDYNGYNPVNITAFVLDEYGNKIKSGVVTFNLAGEEYAVNVSKGIANIVHDFNKGQNLISAIFKGDGYESSFANKSIDVLKIDVEANITISTQLNTAIINISTSPEVIGNGIIYLEGKNYTINLTNGVGSLIVNYLENKNYTFHFELESKTYECNISKNFTITFSRTKIIAENFTTYVYGNEKFVIKLINETSNVSGKTINFEINNQHLIATTDDNGEAYININLTSGEYLITIEFAGDGEYLFSKSNATVTVNKVDSSLTVEDVVLDYGGSVNVTVTTEGAIGVVAKIGDDDVDVVGNVICVPVLGAGNYTLSVTTVPDSNHNSVTKTSVVTVNKIESQVNASDLIATVGKEILLTVNVVSSNVVYEGSIALISGETNIAHANVIDGIATLAFTPSKAGNYTLLVVYNGTSIYKSSNATILLIVLEDVNNTNSSESNATGGNVSETNTTKPTPEVVIPPLDKPSTDGSVAISLPSDATGTVILTVNGKEYEFEVKNGVANVKLPDLAEGNYQYTITYSGDGKYSSFTTNGTLNKAAPEVDPEITASNANVVYTAGSYYTITVKGTDGKSANGITVKITGKISKTLPVTNGVAKFKIDQVPGTYKITISALGKSVTKTITVKHIVTLKTVTVKKSAKKLVLQATLSKVNGKYLKNKKITFKFNGKKYTAKTDKKGVAKVTIKSSVLKKLKVGKKVTYQATYSKDTVKKTVKVKK